MHFFQIPRDLILLLFCMATSTTGDGMPTWNDDRESPNQIAFGHKNLGEIEEFGQHSDFVEQQQQLHSSADNDEPNVAVCLPKVPESQTPPLFEWESASVSINYTQPVRFFSTTYNFLLGIERKTDGTFCAKLGGNGMLYWPVQMWTSFQFDWESTRQTRFGFGFKWYVELQLKKGSCQFDVQLGEGLKLIGWIFMRKLRNNTAKTWQNAAAMLARGMVEPIQRVVNAAVVGGQTAVCQRKILK